MMPRPAILLLAAALTAAGCAADSQPADDCSQPLSPASMVEDAVVLGLAGADGAAGDFRPVADGGAMELELGSQGGWMITPTLAIDRAMMASDGACVHVTVEVALDGNPAMPPVGFDLMVPELAGTDDHFYSEPLPVLLSYDLAELDARTATISTTVEDDEVAASCQVAVRLENRR